MKRFLWVVLWMFAACGDTQNIVDDIPENSQWDPNSINGTNNGYGYGYGNNGTNNVTGPPCDEIVFSFEGSADSVWVTGSFTNWAPTDTDGALPLDDNGDGTWSLTTTLDRGRHYYKFIVDGNQWIVDGMNTETLPDQYLGNNSVLDVCVPLPAPTPGTVTFLYENATATTVEIAGTFNNWMPEPMVENFDLWTITKVLQEGEHQYKFVVDGNYIQDPANPDGVDDGFGGMNSVLVVDNSVLGSVCGDLETFDWRDAVMYFAMVDRFHDSDNSRDQVPGATDGPGDGPSGQYMGGDLQGMRDKLDYLTDLGVTAIWLSAPYENRNTAGAGLNFGDNNMYSAYHGYWPSPADIDYSDLNNPSPRPMVESRIGTDQQLKDFISEAHGATSANGDGVKVLFDYVMNHVDEDSALAQAHPDWFATENGNPRLCGPENLWDDPYWGTRCAFTDYLPAFDFSNAAARNWSVDDAIWWAKEYELDGYRLDAIKHVPLEWLTDLRARLNQEFPEPEGGRFYLVGETFDYFNRDLLKSFVDPLTMLDGQFDFPFKAELCGAAFRPDGSLETFSNWMDGNDGYYGFGSLMTTWIGNHDIPRAIHFASGQIPSCTQGSDGGNAWTASYNQPADAAPYERLGLSFTVMMTSPGIPLIYYGDEIGLAGGGDPDNRRMMVFEDNQLNQHQIALRERVRTLSRIRSENKSLTRGVRNTLSVNQNTWVYEMGGCGSDAPTVLIAMNRSDGPQSVTVPAGTYTDLMNDAMHNGGNVQLPPRSELILRVEP